MQEEFTSQVLNFYHTLMLVVGFDPSEIINLCAATLPYSRLNDVLRILKLTVDNFKQDGLAIMINGISHVL